MFMLFVILSLYASATYQNHKSWSSSQACCLFTELSSNVSILMWCLVTGMLTMYYLGAPVWLCKLCIRDTSTCWNFAWLSERYIQKYKENHRLFQKNWKNLMWHHTKVFLLSAPEVSFPVVLNGAMLRMNGTSRPASRLEQAPFISVINLTSY